MDKIIMFLMGKNPDIYNLYMRNGTVNRSMRAAAEIGYEKCLESALVAIASDYEKSQFALNKYVARFGDEVLMQARSEQ